MELLPISIGQAGNQINYELANLMLENECYMNEKYFMKNVLIDTEKKVISKNYEGKFSTYYQENMNVVSGNSGRGNNWALGYSLDYTEVTKGEGENINLKSFNVIQKFLEKCDFYRGFMFIHSLNGGTGSGVSTRLIEMLHNEYPKFTIIDCPVVGFQSKNKK